MNELEIQSDADAIDDYLAVVNQFLVGDIRIDKFTGNCLWHDKFDGFRTLFSAHQVRKQVHNREIVNVKAGLFRNCIKDVFQLWREKEIKGLCGLLYRDDFSASKCSGFRKVICKARSLFTTTKAGGS